MAVEGISRNRKSFGRKQAKKPKKSKSEKAQLARQIRFGIWAINIDANKDGKISTEELQARITARQSVGKAHPFASAVLNNLSTLDTDADGTVTRDQATTFLVNAFAFNEKKAKKLDASA